MSSDCGDLLLSLSEAIRYPKQAHLFSFELFLVNIKTHNRLETKFSIQVTSAFNDEQTAVKRKEYLGQPTIRLRRYGGETSMEGIVRRRKEEEGRRNAAS